MTFCALLVAALAVVAPFTVRGVACGHDLAFHMNSWMEVAQQWHEGVLYPRWAVNANYGGGEPRFLFYPPLSWILGGILGSMVPWLFAPVGFDCCAVLLAGLAMHRMARQWFEEADATLIAVAYAINPYLLLNIYVRSAFGELLAASFLPLIVLWIVRERPAREMFVPLALTIAGVWLTNIPAAIMATYATVTLLVLVTVLRRNSRVFVYGAGALATGLALASFHIVPVVFERGWIVMGQLLSPGVRPFENFLFTQIGDPEHDHFLRTLSWLAVGEVAVTAMAILATWRWRKAIPRPGSKLGWSLIVLFGLALVLMLPVSKVAYQWMPQLQFLQFPWRWLLVLGLAYAVFVVAAVPRFRGKVWLFAGLFIVLIGGCNRALQGGCDPADTPFMISNLYHTGYGYMGTDEYVPTTGDNYEIKPDFPEFRFRSEEGTILSTPQVTHLHTSPYHKQYTVESPQPVQMVLRLMKYPAWRVEVNGAQITPQSEDPTGRMVITLPTGHSQVDVKFVRTPDRWLGDGISLAAAMLLCGFWYSERKELLPQRHRGHRGHRE